MMLETECIPAIIQRSESLADWYKMAQTVYLQIQLLDKDLDNYERSLEALSYRLTDESSERHEALWKLLDQLPSGQTSEQASHLPSCIREEGTKMWRNICDTQHEIRGILKDNNELFDCLGRLSESCRLHSYSNFSVHSDVEDEEENDERSEGNDEGNDDREMRNRVGASDRINESKENIPGYRKNCFIKHE